MFQVEAACYIRDVNSAGVIVDKVCDCNGTTTVHCNVGPITVGDIELTFCNKKPSQPIDDLLFMVYGFCFITTILTVLIIVNNYYKASPNYYGMKQCLTPKSFLLQKFACDSSDPACGEGTACDIGPIEYDNNKYYLCTDQVATLLMEMFAVQEQTSERASE